jgi:hypothetical protein
LIHYVEFKFIFKNTNKFQFEDSANFSVDLPPCRISVCLIQLESFRSEGWRTDMTSVCIHFMHTPQKIKMKTPSKKIIMLTSSNLLLYVARPAGTVN